MPHNINVIIKDDQYEKLLERAEKNETNVSHEVRQIIKKEFEKKK